MAEKCVMEKVEDILTCSMCLGVLVDPRTFSCLHSYCKCCSEQLKPSTKEGVDGYECPQCRRFTPKAEVKVVHLIVQLLDAYHAAKNAASDAKCSRCGTELAKWQCLDCKQFPSFCDSCRNSHDEFAKSFGTEHQIVSRDEMDQARPVLDKPLHCEEHKENKLEVFCKECHKTICVLCKIFHHDGHQAEPIADALQRLLPQFIAGKEKLGENIKANEEQIKIVKTEKEEAKTTYKATQDQLDKDLEDGIEKLKAEHREKTNELKAEEQKEMKDYDSAVQAIEDKITEQKQVLSWVKTTLERTKGVMLLKELQAGLLDKVEAMAGEDAMTGGKTSDIRIQESRYWPWKMLPAGKGQYVQRQTINLPINSLGSHQYTRISVVWNMLWLFNHRSNQLVKYTLDGTLADTVQMSGKIQTPRTAIQTSPTEVIIAAKSGLYSINKQGEIGDGVIAEGDYLDLCIAEDMKMYALENTKGLVTVMRRQGIRWAREHDIVLSQEYVKSPHYFVNTMVVKNNVIYIAMVSSHTFVVSYDISGKMIRKYGSFSNPSVCGIDSDNAVLVSDYGYNQMKRLCHDGTCTVLFSPAHNPWHAVFVNENTVWVTNNNQLMKYTTA